MGCRYVTLLELMMESLESSAREKYFHALEDEGCPKCDRHWIDTEMVRDIYLYYCPCAVIRFLDPGYLRHIIRRYSVPHFNEEEELYFGRMVTTAAWKIQWLTQPANDSVCITD